MSEIKIPNAEDINKQITEAIAKSAIGEELIRIVDKKVKELSNSQGSPLEKVVDNEIVKLIIVILSNDPIKSYLRDSVSKAVSDRITNDTIGNIVDIAFDKMKKY